MFPFRVWVVLPRTLRPNASVLLASGSRGVRVFSSVASGVCRAFSLIGTPCSLESFMRVPPWWWFGFVPGPLGGGGAQGPVPRC
jgi:hypothetical protein